MMYNIYIIKNSINDKVYIGSTNKENIKHRLYQHILCTVDGRKAETHGKLIRAMKELGDDNFTIELIENIDCDDLVEVRCKESYWIRHYESWRDDKGYNTRIDGRTKKEYYNDTKEHTLQRVKNYYENNKEARDEYKKQHYIENREHFQNYKQEWYLKNKDTHNLKGKERIMCECGIEVCRASLRRHLQSERHKNKIVPS